MTDHTAALTYSDALRIARGCTDYGGGYRGDAALFEAYQHGIQTVITALTHADPKDSQTRALMAMGGQPQQPAGCQETTDEAAEILRNLIVNIEEDGLYSEEGMLTFLTQALSCLKPANAAHPSQQEDDERDGARLDWMFGQECFVESVLTEDGPAYRVHWPDDGSWQTELFTTPRYAIDAAMSDIAGEA